MENASKALLIAGAILLCILIIAIGMFIYNSASSTITDSLTSLSTQEVEAFNNQFTSYEGIQTGSNVKALMGRLIGNANIYRDESNKIPGVVMEELAEDELIVPTVANPPETENDVQEYIQKLTSNRNSIDSRHEYYVEITYQTDGLIDYIHVSYDELNPITDLKYR